MPEPTHSASSFVSGEDTCSEERLVQSHLRQSFGVGPAGVGRAVGGEKAEALIDCDLDVTTDRVVGYDVHRKVRNEHAGRDAAKEDQWNAELGGAAELAV